MGKFPRSTINRFSTKFSVLRVPCCNVELAATGPARADVRRVAVAMPVAVARAMAATAHKAATARIMVATAHREVVPAHEAVAIHRIVPEAHVPSNSVPTMQHLPGKSV